MLVYVGSAIGRTLPGQDGDAGSAEAYTIEACSRPWLWPVGPELPA